MNKANYFILQFLQSYQSTKVYSMENNASGINEPDVFIHYAVFFNDEQETLPIDEFIEQCDLDGIRKISKISSPVNEASLLVTKQDIDKLPAPSLQVLQYFGRGFDQAKADRILASNYSVSFVGVGPFDRDHTLLKKITECVASIAKKYDAFIFDVADSVTFTAESFGKIRLEEINQGLLSSAQFGVRAYRVDTGIRSVSMGLEKFGQPNLAIENFSEHHMGYMEKLFNMLLQRVIESPVQISEGPILVDIVNIANPNVRRNLDSSIDSNGSGKFKIVLKEIAPLDGDPSKLLAINFEFEPGDKLWSEQAKLLKYVFGKDRDVSNVPDSVSLDSAIESARSRAKSIIELGHALEKDGMRMLVATVLAEGKEVVWVEVVNWENLKGIGILLSNPIHNKNLSSGMRCELSYDSIMDFKLYGPDGLVEMGGVDELARQLGSQQ